MNYIYDSRSRKRPLVWVLLFAIGVGLVLFLYLVKINALETKTDIQKLKSAIAQEEQAVKLLSAELAYLQNPDRLSKLANEYLQLQPTKGAQNISLDEAMKKISQSVEIKPDSYGYKGAEQ